MLNKDVHDALLSGEFGDARSFLDEHDPLGAIDVRQLNKINPNVEWSFDNEAGWSYLEI